MQDPLAAALELLRGTIAGIAATAAMTVVETIAWHLWGKPAVLEWQENEALAARLFRRSDRLLRPGLGMHYAHGALAGVVFVVGLSLVPIPLPAAAAGIPFGLALFLVELAIHKPVTGKSPFRGAERGTALAVSVFGHILYGAVLGLLVGWI